MQINVIHIYGGSGSGTSTLGYAFSRESGFYFMDADDYLWLPTNPRFTQMRERGERVRLMKEDIKEHKKWLFPVLSRAGEILSSPCLILPFVW